MCPKYICFTTECAPRFILFAWRNSEFWTTADYFNIISIQLFADKITDNLSSKKQEKLQILHTNHPKNIVSVLLFKKQNKKKSSKLIFMTAKTSVKLRKCLQHWQVTFFAHLYATAEAQLKIRLLQIFTGHIHQLGVLAHWCASTIPPSKKKRQQFCLLANLP